MNETLKWCAVRTPGIQRLLAPKYAPKVDPGELSAMIRLIDATRDSGGSVYEIGVARGSTSVVLLEHLRTTGDSRPLIMVDTFAGFTEDSIEFEVTHRRKDRSALNAFRYGDRDFFERSLHRAGYTTGIEVVKTDAALYDFEPHAPIGAMLLDIDLYLPTLAILRHAYPLVCVGGGIVVDDCLPDSTWDGALQAYEEFIAEIGAPFRRVGGKGGLILKNQE